MSDNLKLWDAVEKTDPSQTRPIVGKAYKGTSPRPYHIIHKATEMFGPCGIGWGFSIISERVEDGADGDKVHIAHVRVWYNWGGVRGELEHVGETMFSGKRNNDKAYTDEDAPKKSVTDALVKALSLVGFAGDIFMGRFDDDKYVNDLRAEFNGGAAPPPPEVRPASKPTYAPNAKTVVALKAQGQLCAETSMEALERFWTSLSKEERVAVGGKEQIDAWKLKAESVNVDKETV